MNQETIDQFWIAVRAIGADPYDVDDIVRKFSALKQAADYLGSLREVPKNPTLDNAAEQRELLATTKQMLSRLATLETLDLTPAQLQICAETGCSPEQFRAVKASRK